MEQLDYPIEAEALAERLARLASSEADHCVVAEADGNVVGFASLHASLSIVDDQPVSKLSAIVVDTEHRHRGIGEALVSAIEADARTRGCSLIFLTTAEHREDAHIFYRRIGFEETGRRFAKRLA